MRSKTWHLVERISVSGFHFARVTSSLFLQKCHEQKCHVIGVIEEKCGFYTRHMLRYTFHVFCSLTRRACDFSQWIFFYAITYFHVNFSHVVLFLRMKFSIVGSVFLFILISSRFVYFHLFVISPRDPFFTLFFSHVFSRSFSKRHACIFSPLTRFHTFFSQ